MNLTKFKKRVILFKQWYNITTRRMNVGEDQQLPTMHRYRTVIAYGQFTISGTHELDGSYRKL